MPSYTIEFSDREILPDLIEMRAEELDMTVEQLLHRLVLEGMRDYGLRGVDPQPGRSAEEFFVNAGVLKPKK